MAPRRELTFWRLSAIALFTFLVARELQLSALSLHSTPKHSAVSNLAKHSAVSNLKLLNASSEAYASSANNSLLNSTREGVTKKSDSRDRVLKIQNENAGVRSKRAPLLSGGDVGSIRKNGSAVDIVKRKLRPKGTPNPALKKTFVRAAVMNLPGTKDSIATYPQLRWFHRSWKEMSKFEPKLWRTDIVIISSGYAPIFDELNCTRVERMHQSEPPMCRFLETYVSLQERVEMFKGYYFADSIDVLTLNSSLLDPYDYILRTDLDTFLTPAFATWHPEDGKFLVGDGTYIYDPFTSYRLMRIARGLDLKNTGMMNIGTTWYGPAKLIRQCAMMSINMMRYLHDWEFTPIEKDRIFWSDKATNWPIWHFGVLTLYSGHLAVNHLVDKEKLEKQVDMLDWPPQSNESIGMHAHMHATHSRDGHFNKFAFREGEYANWTLNSLNLTKCNDYALYMALDSSKGAPVYEEFDKVALPENSTVTMLANGTANATLQEELKDVAQVPDFEIEVLAEGKLELQDSGSETLEEWTRSVDHLPKIEREVQEQDVNQLPDKTEAVKDGTNFKV